MRQERPELEALIAVARGEVPLILCCAVVKFLMW